MNPGFTADHVSENRFRSRCSVFAVVFIGELSERFHQYQPRQQEPRPPPSPH
jgi:hypothetical protein